MTKKRGRIDYWHDPDAPKPDNRKASASVYVLDDHGRLLLLRRADNDLWTIPTGGIKKGETVAEAGVRECFEETGIEVEVTGLVGVFSDPGHVIAYTKGDKIVEVRQPINICLRARPVGGTITPAPAEATEVRWVPVDEVDNYDMAPAIRARVAAGLDDAGPVIA